MFSRYQEPNLNEQVGWSKPLLAYSSHHPLLPPPRRPLSDPTPPKFRVEDMCRSSMRYIWFGRTKADVDESDHHALVNSGEGILCGRRRGRRRGAREGACVGGATTSQPSTLRLIRNAAALCRRKSDFALQALVEGRAAKMDLVRVVLRWHSCGSEVRLGLPVGL